jgi:hypothetical protein
VLAALPGATNSAQERPTLRALTPRTFAAFVGVSEPSLRLRATKPKVHCPACVCVRHNSWGRCRWFDRAAAERSRSACSRSSCSVKFAKSPPEGLPKQSVCDQ